MKKLLCLLIFVVMLVGVLAACDNGVIPGPDNGGNNENTAQKEDVITVEDGYLVVNGVKTDYQVKTDDVIEVVDGYVTVNGVKTEHKVDTPDVIEIIDGYVYVNGIKTDIFVPSCNHSWTIVTTDPTCTAGGYDTLTCTLCGKSIKDNETAKLDHTYSTTYSFDDNNHWFKCTDCDAKKDTTAHTPDADNNCTVCGTPLAATPGIIYDISADGTYAEVIGYNGTASKVKIASEYNGLPVKNIYNEAFKNNTTITSVIIPDSVTTIGDYAFYYCASIEQVVIPDSVISIGSYAFASNMAPSENKLKSVVIGNGVTSIGPSAFYFCTNLESITFGNNLRTIDNYAFYCCYSLTSVVIPDSVTSIGDYAFCSCSSLTSIEIPDSVTSIGYRAFEYCLGLTSVVIGDSVTNIGEYAFFGCHSDLYTEYEFGKYVRSDDNPYAVLIEITNKNMSNYTIHEDTQVVAYGAFKNCSRLTSITIPNGVKAIGDWAFDACQALTSIVIPDSVVRIGVEAFGTCYNLANVYYTGNESDWDRIIVDGINTPLTNATIHYNYVSTT